MSLFASMINATKSKYLSCIVLLNKLDLFTKRLDSKPVRNYFPSYSGDPDASIACGYFASEFAKLDKRPNASVQIYKTNAVDRDTFKSTMDSIAQRLDPPMYTPR